MLSVKVYLSHGGGVNSWALYLYLMEQGERPGEDFEAVFVDHGTDWPETYEYMDMMIGRGYPVTVIRPEHDGCKTVYDFCEKWAIIPNRRPGSRWCTHHFKVNPVKKYQQKPCVDLIGFDSGEENRVKGVIERDGVMQDFPLISEGIDRVGCIEIIKRHGTPEPPKSGCYICPFQTRGQWVQLKREHPELFCRAVQLEKATNERRAAADKEPVYFRDIPLETLVLPKDNSGRRAIEGQGILFDPDFDRPPCRCGL